MNQTPRRSSSSAPRPPGHGPPTTATSRDLHIVFIYDLFRNKNEADDPSDSILYFTPATIPEEKRVAICGQLMGLTHFMNFNFSSPSLISLANGKFALRKLSKEYVLAIGSSSATPDWLISQQINILVELLRFYYDSLDFNGRILGGSSGSPSPKLSYMMDYYLDIVYTNDIFSLSFGILPIINIPKSAPGISLKSSLILQSCRLRPGVLGGVLMYQNKVVTVDILESIGQKLGFIKQDRIPPGELVTRFPKLPQRVQLLNIYIQSHELEELVKMARKYQCPNVRHFFIIKLQEFYFDYQLQEPNPTPKSMINYQKKCPNDSIVEEKNQAEEQSEMDLDSNPNDNLIPDIPNNNKYKLRRCQSLIDIEVQQLEVPENNSPGSAAGSSLGKCNSLLNLKESRLLEDEQDSSYDEAEIIKIQNHDSSSCSQSQSESEVGSSIPEFIRPHSNDIDYLDCGSSSRSTRTTRSSSTRSSRGSESLQHEQIPHPNPSQNTNNSGPYYNNKSISISSTESLHSNHNNVHVDLKLKRLDKKRTISTSEPNPNTTYEKCMLYIFNDGWMRLLLVLDKETEISVIENITNYCETILPELKKELTLVENLDPVQVDPYCFLRYESMWKSLSGGKNNEFMDTHSIQHMHQNFQVYPDINELIIRANDHVMYGYQCVGSEVFYQQRAGLQPGLPMPSDLMGKVPDKAKRRLERDHSIVLL